jgi:hypothetical protein
MTLCCRVAATKRRTVKAARKSVRGKFGRPDALFGEVAESPVFRALQNDKPPVLGSFPVCPPNIQNRVKIMLADSKSNFEPPTSGLEPND